MRRALLIAPPLAALAVWLWTSAQLPADPPAVAATAVFSHAQIARAQHYRDLGYGLTLAAIALQLAPAWLLAWRGGGRLVRLPAVVAALLVALVIAAAPLPIDYWQHLRSRDYGLDLRSGSTWASDAALGVLVQSLAVALVYAIGRVAYRRLGALGVALAAWAMVAVLTALQPLVIDPLYVSTHPLPALPAALAASLEREMGAHPSSITVGDASSRTTAENARVDGLGPTVRVVVDDTSLTERRDELRALLAHELAHVSRRHTLIGVLWFGVIGLPAILLVLAAAGRLTEGELTTTAAVPVVLACALTAATLLLPVENLLSRRIEAEADWVGLRATHDPQGMRSLQRRLALSDLSNPDPPGWAVWLLFDHPPVMDRIAVARAYVPPSSSSLSSTP
ncbi:MAG: endopeptidase [Gaiellales bacterium]|nr:endopeptidase [Gaiellales bacterium]